MITFIARLHVPPENALAFEELMTYVAAMTQRARTGCRLLRVREERR